METEIKEFLTVGSPIPAWADAMRRLGDVYRDVADAFAKAQMLSALADNPLIDHGRIGDREAVLAKIENPAKITSAELNAFVANHCSIERGRIALSLEQQLSKPNWRHNRMGFLDGLQRHGKGRR